MIPLSVFVVHPDPTVAARIARAVAAAGHAPVLLSDGERAIDRFVQEPADVLVVEYFLPGRDGAATLESIRWAPGGRDVHVVLLAAREPEPVALGEIGRRVGAVATFVGPPDEEAIAGVLASLGPRSGDPGARTDVEALRIERRAGRPPGRRGAETHGGDDVAMPEPYGAADEAAHWPLVETVMAHASPRVDDAGSGVQRREAISGRPASPMAARPDPEPTREVDPARAARLREHALALDEATLDEATLEEGHIVREGARASAEGSQRVMGRFEQTPFPALLRKLADQRTTGALVCIAEGSPRETTNGDPPTKIVYFRGGVPVHVRSNLLAECLGQTLLRRRRIGIATLEESIRRMQQGEGLQGEILVDMGALAPLELGEALAEQARDKLFDLFSWERGTYRLSSRLEPPTNAVGIELGLAEIVYEGVCAAMPPTRLLERLAPHLDRFVVVDPVPLARFSRVRIVPEVRQVLARIDGSRRLREVLAMGSRPGAVAQLLYAMECLGAVRFADAPAPGRGGAEPRAAAVALPGDGRGEPTIAHAPAGAPSGGEPWDDSTVPERRRPAPEASAPPPRPERAGPASGGSPGQPVGGVDERVGRLFEAERQVRRGHRALERGRLDDALAAFARAHELCPEQGEFLAYVGWARHSAAPDDPVATERALAELARACELAPDLHVTHLLRARVLARTGRPEQARAAYRRVLELNPGCAEAQQAVD